MLRGPWRLIYWWSGMALSEVLLIHPGHDQFGIISVRAKVDEAIIGRAHHDRIALLQELDGTVMSFFLDPTGQLPPLTQVEVFTSRRMCVEHLHDRLEAFRVEKVCSNEITNLYPLIAF